MVLAVAMVEMAGPPASGATLSTASAKRRRPVVDCAAWLGKAWTRTWPSGRNQEEATSGGRLARVIGLADRLSFRRCG